MLRLVSLFLVSSMLTIPSSVAAHDFWSNGDPVPSWVKSWCCGQNDVHQLRPGAVHIKQDGYHIDGIATVVPISKAMPSADGKYWAFWKSADEPKPNISCFFAPPEWSLMAHSNKTCLEPQVQGFFYSSSRPRQIELMQYRFPVGVGPSSKM